MGANGEMQERHLPDNFVWPDERRLAVALTFDTQPGITLPSDTAGRRSLRNVKEHEYEGRVGIHRVLEILERYDVKATFPTCARTAERYPEACRAIIDQGHEMAAHGYDHERINELSVEQEDELIARTVESFQHSMGLRPYGWRSPFYLATEETPRLLAKNGFTWNSDFHNDDLPYLIQPAGSPSIVEIPPQFDDWRLYWADIHAPSTRAVRGTPRNILSVAVDAFDVLLSESARRSKLLCITFHPGIVGRPDRSIILSGFLEHARRQSGVWWAKCGEIVDAVAPQLQETTPR